MSSIRTLSLSLVAAVVTLAACSDSVTAPTRSGPSASGAQAALSAGGGGNANVPQISWCPICKIAFTQYDTLTNVFSVATGNPDASALATVFTGGMEPTWNTQHTQIALARVGGGITVINADGTGRTDLTGRHDYEPNFSPDGTRIVFERYMADNTTDLWITTANGLSQYALTNTPGTFESGPQFSPDGKKLVVARYTPAINTGDLVVLDLVANSLIVIPTVPATGSIPQTPTWSPDSKRIAFTFQNNAVPNCLAFVNADGSNLVLYPRIGKCRNPSWSPDGTGIALQTNVTGGSNFSGGIGTLDLHSGAVIPMVKGPWNSTPAWMR